MKANELAQLNLNELRALRGRVDDAIATREQEDRAELKAKLADLASNAGFSINELFTGLSASNLASIKYRNPQDPSQTWTGLGRKPKWLLQAGGNAERFRVKHYNMKSVT